MKKKVKYPNIESCDPRACVSGNMMKSNRIVANVFRKYLKSFDITDSQLSILFVVTKAKSVNQKMIADKLYLEKSSVNRNIARLIDRKYISFDDNLYLQTTEKGLKFLEEIIPEWEIAMQEIKKILGKDGVHAVTTITQKLTN